MTKFTDTVVKDAGKVKAALQFIADHWIFISAVAVVLVVAGVLI